MLGPFAAAVRDSTGHVIAPHRIRFHEQRRDDRERTGRRDQKLDGVSSERRKWLRLPEHLYNLVDNVWSLGRKARRRRLLGQQRKRQLRHVVDRIERYAHHAVAVPLTICGRIAHADARKLHDRLW